MAPFTNRTPVLSPTQLNLYAVCPERYFHRYVERQRPPEPFSRALAKGTATHSILEACAKQYQRTGEFPNDLEPLIRYHLRRVYPMDIPWEGDIESVLSDVLCGLSNFVPGCTVVATEGTYDYGFPGSAHCPPFILRAKVDLILKHSGGDREHIDWKTGGRREVDEIQNACCRIVTAQNFKTDHEDIISTTAFLGARDVCSERLDRSQVLATWGRIRETAAAILGGQSWEPKRSFGCNYCPFYGGGCSLDSTESSVRQLTLWLETTS